MLNESDIVTWCQDLFRRKKRGAHGGYRDAAMQRCMEQFHRDMAIRRYWRDAEDRDAWERACDPPG